jgi:hypothetical protein
MRTPAASADIQSPTGINENSIANPIKIIAIIITRETNPAIFPSSFN